MSRPHWLGVSVAATMAAAVTVITPSVDAAPAKQTPLPNPCTTFTTAQAQAAFGGHPHLSKARIRATSYQTCAVASATRSLHVTISRTPGAAPTHAKCYRHYSLGHGGRVCVSTSKTSPGTTALIAKDGLHIIDVYSATTGHHGKALYRFAAHQRKRLK